MFFLFSGDVRGQGMFLGVDLVKNRETREPATAEAAFINKRLNIDSKLKSLYTDKLTFPCSSTKLC